MSAPPLHFFPHPVRDWGRESEGRAGELTYETPPVPPLNFSLRDPWRKKITGTTTRVMTQGPKISLLYRGPVVRMRKVGASDFYLVPKR